MKSAIIAAVAVVAALVVAGWFVDDRFQEWKARAEAADSAAQVQVLRAEEAANEAAVQRLRADSLARIAGRRDTVIREQIRVVREVPIPAPCSTVVSMRDAIIDSLVAVGADYRAAYETERKSGVGLRLAYVRMRSTVDTLRAVLADVPTPRPAWIPTVGVGPFVGVCVDGRPCGGLGASLQWRVRFPWLN